MKLKTNEKPTLLKGDNKELQEKGVLISVIIPVYNVALCLKRCLESVIHQTYKNLEILLIDDGSSDGSGLICDQYEKQDYRIKVFHKDNGGLSSARNYGLRCATGNYIGFVDSDDYIDVKMYEHLIRYMNEDVDLVTCGVRDEYIKKYKRKYYASHFVSEYHLMSKYETLRELLISRKLNFSVCNKLFKRKLFNNIIFPEGRSSEDIPVIYGIICNINFAVNNGYADYHYVHHSGSITSGNFFEGRMDYCHYTKIILDDVLIHYPQFEKEAAALYVKSVYFTMCQILDSSNRYLYKETFKYLKNILIENRNVIKESIYINENMKKDMLSKLEKNIDDNAFEFCDGLQSITVQDTIEKLSEFYNILIQWISLKQKGITAVDFIMKKGYRTVAIYGMKELGEILYEELKTSDICVTYIIDKSIEPIFIDVPVLRPDEPLFPVDVIIVTAIHYFKEIEEQLKNKIDCPIYSLEDVIFFEYE